MNPVSDLSEWTQLQGQCFHKRFDIDVSEVDANGTGTMARNGLNQIVTNSEYSEVANKPRLFSARVEDVLFTKHVVTVTAKSKKEAKAQACKEMLVFLRGELMVSRAVTQPGNQLLHCGNSNVAVMQGVSDAATAASSVPPSNKAGVAAAKPSVAPLTTNDELNSHHCGSSKERTPRQCDIDLPVDTALPFDTAMNFASFVKDGNTSYTNTNTTTTTNNNTNTNTTNNNDDNNNNNNDDDDNNNNDNNVVNNNNYGYNNSSRNAFGQRLLPAGSCSASRFANQPVEPSAGASTLTQPSRRPSRAIIPQPPPASLMQKPDCISRSGLNPSRCQVECSKKLMNDNHSNQTELKPSHRPNNFQPCASKPEIPSEERKATIARTKVIQFPLIQFHYTEDGDIAFLDVNGIRFVQDGLHQQE